MLKNVQNNILFILLISCLSIGTLFTVFAQNSDAGFEVKFLTSNDNTIKDITLNKVVIVGDSRMELLMNDEKVKKPTNFIFDAKSGAAFEWFKETGEPRLLEILNNRDTDYHYHVVFNLGVNDIQYDKGNIDEISDNYINEYNKIVKRYSDVDFYFLSINPIDEKLLKKSQPENTRTNREIDELNEYFKNSTKQFANYSYCDSHSKLEFLTDDGIHYKSETNQDIVDFIARECVNYK